MKNTTNIIRLIFLLLILCILIMFIVHSFEHYKFETSISELKATEGQNAGFEKKISILEIWTSFKHHLITFSIMTIIGGVIYYYINLEIKKRIKYQEYLLKSEQEFKSLVETAQQLIWKCDNSGRFTYLNPAWEKTHKYKLNEMLGKKFTDFLPENRKEKDLSEFRKHLKGKALVAYETIHLDKYGNKVYLAFSAIPMPDTNGIIIDTQGTAIDITQRKLAEQKNNEAEKLLLKTIVETEEKERSKLARELHDGLGPILSNIQMYFQWLAEGDENKDLIIEKGSLSFKKAFETVKEISHNMGPSELINHGLPRAILRHVELSPYLSNIKFKFTENISERLEINIETTLYRCILELLNNSNKHANASSIDLIVHKEIKSLFIDYKDNGGGFDTENLKNQGMGLENIEFRIKSINGYFKVNGRHQGGMHALIQIPLEQ